MPGDRSASGRAGRAEGPNSGAEQFASLTRYFDEVAVDYDEQSADVWVPNTYPETVLADVDWSPRRILDLGAGTGQTARVLQHRFADAHLDLVEPSAGMAHQAGEAVPTATVHRVDVDAYFESTTESYDLIVSVGACEFFPDLATTLRTAVSRLDRGGRLVITYAPVIDRAGEQGRLESILSHDTGTLTTIRHQPEEVTAALLGAGLSLEIGRLFCAYQRDDAPVIYHLIGGTRR